MREGRLQDAHRHCLAVLEADRRHADAWFLCGVIAAHNGQTAKAVEILEKAVGLAPDNPEYRAELGKLLLATRQPERALQEAEHALRFGALIKPRASAPSQPSRLARTVLSAHAPLPLCWHRLSPCQVSFESHARSRSIDIRRNVEFVP